MNITSKQRAYLKSLANGIDPIFQVGKASLTPELVNAVDEALEKREIIKLSVLKNCFDDPNEIADTMAGRTRSGVVQVIGKKIVLYRPSKKIQKSSFRDNQGKGALWSDKPCKELVLWEGHSTLSIMGI